jgi:hypothetical protein
MCRTPLKTGAEDRGGAAYCFSRCSSAGHGRVEVCVSELPLPVVTHKLSWGKSRSPQCQDLLKRSQDHSFSILPRRDDERSGTRFERTIAHDNKPHVLDVHTRNGAHRIGTSIEASWSSWAPGGPSQRMPLFFQLRISSLVARELRFVHHSKSWCSLLPGEITSCQTVHACGSSIFLNESPAPLSEHQSSLHEL